MTFQLALRITFTELGGQVGQVPRECPIHFSAIRILSMLVSLLKSWKGQANGFLLSYVTWCHMVVMVVGPDDGALVVVTEVAPAGWAKLIMVQGVDVACLLQEDQTATMAFIVVGVILLIGINLTFILKEIFQNFLINVLMLSSLNLHTFKG